MTQTAEPLPPRESFSQTLARNLAIAAIVGAVFAVSERQPALWLPISVLALWFSLGGHYVELLFLNHVRPRIMRERMARVAWRIALWWLGGAFLYVCMAVTARAFPVIPPQFGLWWFGGLLLIGIELVAHAVLAWRGLPNFYRGTG